MSKFCRELRGVADISAICPKPESRMLTRRGSRCGHRHVTVAVFEEIDELSHLRQTFRRQLLKFADNFLFVKFVCHIG